MRADLGNNLRHALAKLETMRIQCGAQGQVFASVSKGQPVNNNDNDPAMRVCTFCGSPRPEELLPQCAHGLVAIVRGKERQALARVHVAFQALYAQRAAAMVLLGNAVTKGTATIDHAPAFDNVGDNVISMYDRDVKTTRKAAP